MEALHHAFFTLGLGMGVMMGVGSYLPIDAPLRRIALTVVIVDTVFSLLVGLAVMAVRSEEHTSELQSLMRISYAVFCLKKKQYNTHNTAYQIYDHIHVSKHHSKLITQDRY